MSTEQLHNHQQIYRAVTADPSQIRDGRDVDVLLSNLDVIDSKPSDKDEEIKLCTHKVGQDGFNAVDGRVFSLSCYRPSRSRGANKASNSVNASDGGVISKSKSIMSSLASSPANKSTRRNSNSSDLDKDLNTSLRRGQPIHRRHSIGTISSPYISASSQYTPRGIVDNAISPNNPHAIASSSSSRQNKNNVKMRRKSEPHHRDQLVNSSVCSIMKIPKYSRTTANTSSPPTPPITEAPIKVTDYSKLLDISNHRFNLSSLNSSLPPSMGAKVGMSKTLLNGLSSSFTTEETSTSSRVSTITSISEEDDWLPRGVEFCSSMEVYVFKVR